jgi:IMP dehydrogenase
MSNKALTYDDIQLVPAYSKITSRKLIDLSTKVSTRFSLDMPIVASPMPTVCGLDMAIEAMKMGGVGCIHRFMSVETQASITQEVASYKNSNALKLPVMAAVGANGDFLERTGELVKAGANIILIDVAHGHHKNVKDAIEKIKTIDSTIDIIAGNIATSKAAVDLQQWGADGLRVGVGGGSLCTTRIKTGFGVPNVSCLIQIIAVSKVPVMADGGLRMSGDIAKALALGSSCVMLGSLLAGTEEAPGLLINQPNGLYKKYSGAASFDTKVTHGQEVRNIEGESTIIPYKGKVKVVIESLLDGVRSALSYAGANDLAGFKPEYVEVTNAGLSEAKPHLL